MISIIIPTYNDNECLQRCLGSIRDSSCKPLEVIVVDDGSAEPVAHIVASYGYRCIRLDINSGQATARNVGASVAHGDILFFIDSDVAVRRDTISKVTEAHKRNDVSVFQGIPSKTSLNSGFGPELLSAKMHYMLKDCTQASYVHSHIFSIKKCVFEEVGGFDTRFRPPGCGEEFDLGHRLRKKYLIHTDPELVADQKGVSVLCRTRVLYHRAYSWASLFSKNRRFEKTNASFSEALHGICSIAAAVCLLVSFFYSIFLFLAALFFLFNLALSMGFYRFLLREKGVVFMLRSILPNMLWAIAAAAGGLCYFIDEFIGRQHESR